MVCTPEEENFQNVPATKWDGIAGLSTSASVFVPSPASVRDCPYVSDASGSNGLNAGSFFHTCALPSIGQQLDFMLAGNFLGQGQQGGNSEMMFLKEEIRCLENVE